MKVHKGNEDITVDFSPAEYRTMYVAISRLAQESPFGNGNAFAELVDTAKSMVNEMGSMKAAFHIPHSSK